MFILLYNYDFEKISSILIQGVCSQPQHLVVYKIVNVPGTRFLEQSEDYFPS